MTSKGGGRRELSTRGTPFVAGGHRPEADSRAEVVSASGRKEIEFALDSETDLCFSGSQMSETIELQGRAWQARELEQIRQWVEQNPTWSRYRLSRELCVGWNWVRPNGQLADMAARSFLNKLHDRALIQLPLCRRASPNRMKHRQLECVRVDSRPVAGELSQLGALQLHEVSRDPSRRAVFETLLATEHYLGYRSPVGENLKYLLCTEPDRSNSHYGPVTPRRVRAPGLHPPQNRPLVGRVPSPGVPIASIMRTAGRIVRWRPGFSAPRPGGVSSGTGGLGGTIASGPPGSID